MHPTPKPHSGQRANPGFVGRDIICGKLRVESRLVDSGSNTNHHKPKICPKPVVIKAVSINPKTPESSVISWITKVDQESARAGPTRFVVKKLTISDIPITDSIWKLATILLSTEFIGLQRLEIIRLEFADNFVKSLFKRLESSKSIRAVEITGVPMTEVLLHALARGMAARQHTQSLVLDGCGLSDTQVQFLITQMVQAACSNIQLELSNNRISSFSPRTWNSAGLVSLGLLGNQLGNNGIIQLAECNSLLGRLALLDLEGCKIGPRGVKGLCRAFDGTRLGSLRLLSLSRNPIGSLGCVHVARLLLCLPALSYLRLSECGIGDIGVVALLSSRPNTREGFALELQGNLVTDSVVPSIASAFKCLVAGQHKSGGGGVRSVDLSRNFLTLDGEMNLAEELEEVLAVYADEAEEWSTNVFVDTSHQRQLEPSTLPTRKDQLELEEEFWSNRDKMSKVVEKYWDGYRETRELERTMGRSDDIGSLSLRGTHWDMPSDGLESAHYVRDGTAPLFNGLSSKQLRFVLRVLVVGVLDSFPQGNTQADECVLDPVSLILQQREQDEEPQPNVVVDGVGTLMSFFQPIRIPTSITITGIDLGSGAGYGSNSAATLFGALAHYTSLVSLSFSRCQIDDFTAEQLLVPVIEASPSLRLLALDHNRLSSKGLCAIAAALTKIKEESEAHGCKLYLNVSHNISLLPPANSHTDMKDVDGVASLDAIWSTLGQLVCSTLYFVDMSYCGVTADRLSRLVADIPINPSLKHLILDGNEGLGDKGFKVIAKSLLLPKERLMQLGKLSAGGREQRKLQPQGKLGNSSAGVIRIIDESRTAASSVFRLKTISLRNCGLTAASFKRIKRVIAAPKMQGVFFDDNVLIPQGLNPSQTTSNTSITDPSSASSFASPLARERRLANSRLSTRTPLTSRLGMDKTPTRLQRREDGQQATKQQTSINDSISGTRKKQQQDSQETSPAAQSMSIAPSPSMVVISLLRTGLKLPRNSPTQQISGEWTEKGLRLCDVFGERQADAADFFYSRVRKQAGTVLVLDGMTSGVGGPNPITAWLFSPNLASCTGDVVSSPQGGS